MNYPDSVRFLYSLGNEVKTAKLGLDSIRLLLNELGNPQEALRVVHIAGTNGKGSTAAMIESGLRAAGWRTGLFTSPHLLEPTERIQVAGRPIGSAAFVEAFEHVHAAAERLIAQGITEYHPTYFETVTAMACVIFARERTDFAVLETGLGGRLDATNAVTKPTLTVITPVDFDHEALLGRSLEAIATEKAGILKPGVPAVFAPQRVEAGSVLERVAKSVEAPVQWCSRASAENVVLRKNGCSFRMNGLEIECPLAGEHQVENAAVAITALASLAVPAAAIRAGIRQTRWPGRLQMISETPEIVADGAHNPAGARALAAHIDRFYRSRRVWLIYGAMRDKAVGEVGGILFPCADRLILTAPAQARAVRPEAVREVAGAESAQVCASVAEALRLYRRQAEAGDVAFVTGSLFLVGEALRDVA